MHFAIRAAWIQFGNGNVYVISDWANKTAESAYQKTISILFGERRPGAADAFLGKCIPANVQR